MMLETITVTRSFSFEFERDYFDKQNTLRSYYAGYAEAMLICFFVNRNYIFRDYKRGETVKDDFLQLFRLQVGTNSGKSLSAKNYVTWKYR